MPGRILTRIEILMRNRSSQLDDGHYLFEIEPMEDHMPLSKKGSKIKSAMAKTYGKKKGSQVFYASQNKGTIKGTHKKGKK